MKRQCVNCQETADVEPENTAVVYEGMVLTIPVYCCPACKFTVFDAEGEKMLMDAAAKRDAENP